MDRSEVIARACAIQGFCGKEELELLYDLARGVPPQHSLVEIGVWFGRTLTVLGLASSKDQLVVGIDPFTPGCPGTMYGPATYHQVRSTLDFHGLYKVMLMPARSLAIAGIWCAPISLVFIDGSHTEEAVSEDAAAWSPFVAKDGVLVFHDYRHPGYPWIEKICNSFETQSDKWEHCGSMTFVRAYRRL